MHLVLWSDFTGSASVQTFIMLRCFFSRQDETLVLEEDGDRLKSASLLNFQA